MAREIRVGMAGYRFIGKAHSHACRNVAMFFKMKGIPVMKVICGGWREGEEAKKSR